MHYRIRNKAFFCQKISYNFLCAVILRYMMTSFLSYCCNNEFCQIALKLAAKKLVLQGNPGTSLVLYLRVNIFFEKLRQ